MNYFIDIDEFNNIVIHKSDCKEIRNFKKSLMSEHFETYDEAYKYAQQKEMIYKFVYKKCSCCDVKSDVKVQTP